MVRLQAILNGILVLLFSVMGGPAEAQGVMKLSSLMQKQEHHEVIRLLQPQVDRKEKLPSFSLFCLASSYGEVRDYRAEFATVDLLEKQVAQGEDHFFGGYLAPYPMLLRSQAYLDLGEPDQAVRAAAAAWAILDSPPGRASSFHAMDTILVQGSLGLAHALLGHIHEADGCLAAVEAVPATGVLGPHKYTAIAKIQMALKRYPKALEALRNPDIKVNALVRMFYNQTFQDLPKSYIYTKCLFETGSLKEARAGFDELLRNPRIEDLGGIHWAVLLDRARIAQAEGEASRAEGWLKEAAEIVERQRASIGTEAGRIGFVGDKQAVYQDLIQLLVASNRPAEAFEWAERAKGRALVDLLASQKRLAGHGQGSEAALAGLGEAEERLTVVPDQPGATGTRGIFVKARADLAVRDPELASLVMVSPVRASAIQARLRPEETLLEYVQAGKAWYAFVVTREDLRAVALDGAGLEERVAKARAAFANPSAAWEDGSAALFRQIYAPVAGLVRGRALTIVPQGPLHYVPFAALAGSGRFLVEDHDLRVLPSASVLTLLKPGKAVSNSLILGNPALGDASLDLAFAQEEAKAVSRILPESTLLLREAATAEAVKASAPHFDLLHFAAHGLFDPDHPLDSAIFLSGKDGSDGRLSVADLYSLSLDADLVTLSACESALSSISKGDDVVGFTRGLLFAGSRSILSSLWKVDDEATRDLMVRFYTGLSGLGKAEALRQAQLSVRAGRPHPYYWAGWLLTGNDR
jgi:CHAT domain-containing protein